MSTFPRYIPEEYQTPERKREVEMLRLRRERDKARIQAATLSDTIDVYEVTREIALEEVGELRHALSWALDRLDDFMTAKQFASCEVGFAEITRVAQRSGIVTGEEVAARLARLRGVKNLPTAGEEQ